MKENLKFNSSLLKRNLWILVILGVLFSSTLFLTFELKIEYIYLLSMLIIFLGMLTVFYLNRFEPEYIRVENENVEIAYFNKVFFKRKNENLIKSDLTIYQRHDFIEIICNDTLKAVIRQKSLEPECWKISLAIFEKPVTNPS